jgi:hypothetical protein
MSSDTKLVWGRTFKEPSGPDHLVDESIFDCPPAAVLLCVGAIPVVGIVSALGSLIASVQMENEFGIAEHAWRVVVYSAFMQLAWLGFFAAA